MELRKYILSPREFTPRRAESRGISESGVYEFIKPDFNHPRNVKDAGEINLYYFELVEPEV